jgi:hypothetical protein
LKLVGVLSYGKLAKRLADGAIDKMQDVQNLRKAIYEWVFVNILWAVMFLFWTSNKLKIDACEKGSSKEQKLREITVKYL